MDYRRTKDGAVVKRKVKPVAIMFSEYYFYLTAFIDDEAVRADFDVIMMPSRQYTELIESRIIMFLKNISNPIWRPLQRGRVQETSSVHVWWKASEGKV